LTNDFCSPDLSAAKSGKAGGPREIAPAQCPAVRDRLESVGVTVVAPERRSPEYLARFIPAEIEKWAGPIKASGVVVE
jgi:hypothetical protein